MTKKEYLIHLKENQVEKLKLPVEKRIVKATHKNIKNLQKCIDKLD